jgi:urease accessory protein UreH
VSTNALQLEAQARDGRTVLSRIRSSGLSRSSRPFREGDAARVVVSQLGPGMVRGDAFALGGRVAPGAHLIVAGQMATRVLSGPEPVTTNAEWHVESGATLELLAEPTLICAGASLVARTHLTLAGDARAIVLELVRREPGAALSVSTTVRIGERLALADTLRWDADDDEDRALGTLVAIGMSIDVEALDRIADTLTGVRAGIGTLRTGGVLARIRGESVWAVQAAVRALLAEVNNGWFERS